MKSKVVRDKRTNKTKGYGFVSFKDPNDFVQAMREMNGKFGLHRYIQQLQVVAIFFNIHLKQISPAGI